MKKLISACVALAAVVSIVGCSVKKIEYEKTTRERSRTASTKTTTG